METVYILTHNGNEMFKGTNDSCFMKLQKMQSNSYTYAVTYEGWKINEYPCNDQEAKEIFKNDPFYYVPCKLLEDVKPTNRDVKVQIIETGETKKANKNAMKYITTSANSIVYVAQSYLS